MATRIATDEPRFAAGFAPRFLQWAAGATPDRRADAASALARARLHCTLDLAERQDAEIAMTALLDDPCAGVRRALAHALSGAHDAPRRLVIALANDRAEVALPLLMRSPVLTDAELVDRVGSGDPAAQRAVAMRPRLGPGPATALAESGDRSVALALIGNIGARLPNAAIWRLIERFGGDEDARQALLARPDLPADIRAEIALLSAERLAPGDLAAERRPDAALAAIALACPDAERMALVRTLKLRGALTLALMLRSLLGGERAFFAAALADLSGLPFARAFSLIGDPKGQGFAALARKAGLPRHALPAFRAALVALAGHGSLGPDGLKRDLVEAAIAACQARRDPALAPILALLGRFAAEAARIEARAVVGPRRRPRTFEPQIETASLEALEPLSLETLEMAGLEALDIEAPSSEPTSLVALSAETPTLELTSPSTPAPEAPSLETQSIETPSVETASVEPAGPEFTPAADCVAELAAGASGIPGAPTIAEDVAAAATAATPPAPFSSRRAPEPSRGEAAKRPARRARRAGRRK
jgi:uncharacterized protein (DUF2336 family)